MIAHLTWQNFRSSIIRPGENRTHRVSSSPLADVFADNGGKRIGMQIQTSGDRTPLDPGLSQLLMLDVEMTASSGRSVLQVTCANKRFFREAYLLFTGVIDRVVSEGGDPALSLQEELSALHALMESGVALSLEKQMGLFGELLVMEQLAKAGGAEMVNCWTGPLGENHDFRLSGHEFEVKTTNSRRRIHTINGLFQAAPSIRCSLTFISVLLAAAGANEGRTLPELVQDLKTEFSSKASHASAFNTALAASGYKEEDSAIYARRWKPRQEIALAPVDNGFPAITAKQLELAMGQSFSRLENISYDVNLEGIAKDAVGGLAMLFKTIIQAKKSP
jgi:hypothetical protein